MEDESDPVFDRLLEIGRLSACGAEVGLSDGAVETVFGQSLVLQDEFEGLSCRDGAADVGAEGGLSAAECFGVALDSAGVDDHGGWFLISS